CHQPGPKEHHRIGNRIGSDRRHAVDQAALDALEEVQLAVGTPEADAFAPSGLHCCRGGADRHLIIHAKDGIDLRLPLKDGLEDVVALLTVEGRTLIRDDFHAGILLELVIEPGHSLNIGAGALHALNHKDIPVAAELLRHALRHLDAHGVVAHPDEAGMGAGNVLIKCDHRDAGLLGLAYDRRQPGRIGRLQDEEIDALADEGLHLAGLLLDIAFAVLDADLHAEALSLLGALVAPIFDERVREGFEYDADLHAFGVGHLCKGGVRRRRQEACGRHPSTGDQSSTQEIAAIQIDTHWATSLSLCAVDDGSMMDETPPEARADAPA